MWPLLSKSYHLLLTLMVLMVMTMMVKMMIMIMMTKIMIMILKLYLENMTPGKPGYRGHWEGAEKSDNVAQSNNKEPLNDFWLSLLLLYWIGILYFSEPSELQWLQGGQCMCLCIIWPIYVICLICSSYYRWQCLLAKFQLVQSPRLA